MAKGKFFLQESAGGTPFILLAEDDDNDAFGMELAFENVGLARRVRRVCDGDQAIDYLRGDGEYRDRAKYPLPSLLLLDLKMAGQDGFAVLEWVRANPRWKNLVTVVLTSSENPADMEKAYALGANSYLVKPSSFASFANMLKLLEGYWSINQVPSSLNRPKPEIGTGARAEAVGS